MGGCSTAVRSGHRSPNLHVHHRPGGLLQYSSLSSFFGGLEALVGTPNPKVREFMAKEHLEQSDSKLEFKASNYDICTTSAVEWAFVKQQAESAPSLVHQLYIPWPLQGGMVARRTRRMSRSGCGVAVRPD